MKRFSLVILAVLLALATVLASSCDVPPSEAQGEKGDNPAKGTESTTDAPDTTDGESAGDSGTVKDEETTLPENTDSSNDETSAEDATEPDDTDEYDALAEKAHAALIEPDEATCNEISEAYGMDLTWLDHEIMESGDSAFVFCFGEFDGWIVFFMPTVMEMIETKEIAGYEFSYSNLFNLTCYRDGVLCSLEEAYENGLVSAEDIGKAAENYGTIQRYWRLQREMNRE